MATERLDELATLQALAEAGSLARAAQALSVPKSTVTRALARLEGSLGVQLVSRGARGLAFTPAGHQLLEGVGPHLAALREALLATREEGAAPAGVLRLTAPPDMGEAFLAELVTRFCQRHPAVRVELELSGRLVALVEEGFDCALRATPRITDERLKAKRLGSTELRLYASPQHVARHGAPSDVAALAGHPQVAFSAAVGELRSSRPLGRGRAPAGASPARLQANDYLFVRAALRAGAGVGALPSFLGGADVAAGLLLNVIPAWNQRGAALWFAYPATEHVPARTLAFRDFVVAFLAARGGFG